MRFALPVLNLLFLLPCLSAANVNPTTESASFYDSCILYYGPHGSIYALDQDGIPAGFCDDIEKSDALFWGTVHSDTSFLKSASSEPDSNGWITKLTERHESGNTFRVRIDSVIKGQFTTDAYIDLEFPRSRESWRMRSKFHHVDAQGRSLYVAEEIEPFGSRPNVPDMAVGLEAIFVVRQHGSLVTPVMIGRREPECVKAQRR